MVFEWGEGVEFLSKFRMEISLLIYWMANVVSTVLVSRKPGLYPKELMEKAQTLAMSKPYPWSDIFVASGIIGIAIIGLNLIIRKSKNKGFAVAGYSFAMLTVFSVLIPTDVGGVYIAISRFIVCTFIFSLVYLMITSWLKRRVTR